MSGQASQLQELMAFFTLAGMARKTAQPVAAKSVRRPGSPVKPGFKPAMAAGRQDFDAGEFVRF
jgi:hypothetical protein